jgi:predicted nucleic acid-binding protein
MSWVNLGEVAYVLQRRLGPSGARSRIPEISAGLTLDLPTAQRVLEAASIKAENRLSYADAFAVATALAHDAVLLTGAPELLDGESTWRIEDLRPRS